MTGDDLPRNPANFVALSPLSFLARSARIFGDRPAIVHGERRTTWQDMYARCRRLAGALAAAGVRRGDVVATLAPNVPVMCEAHFGVPMAGAVLNTLNTRLDAGAIAFQIEHGRARVLIVDAECAALARAALALVAEEARPLVVDADDPEVTREAAAGVMEYETFLAGGDAAFGWTLPDDEWDAIALSYTSGTTGDPKGVVTHHRGAYLAAVNNVLAVGMPRHAAYLWVVPMFHASGWSFPWTVACVAGVNVCLRRVDAHAIAALIAAHGVTHMCAAPIVYQRLIDAGVTLPHRVTGMTGGAPPPSDTFTEAAAIGIDLVHIYGLTETYGPAAICERQASWEGLTPEARAAKVARQGFPMPLQEEMSVRDPATLAPVPQDGETVGEIMFRGNLTMKGYLRNEQATRACFAGGLFRTGDLAVVDPDGYARITDRAKDVIISGGENISSIEVEDVLHRHPAVSAAAVVAAPDAVWGETPCAFVELHAGAAVTAEELRAFCRAQLAGYKMPKYFVFEPIPRTSTGKTQKFMLRAAARRFATGET